MEGTDELVSREARSGYIHGQLANGRMDKILQTIYVVDILRGWVHIELD